MHRETGLLALATVLSSAFDALRRESEQRVASARISLETTRSQRRRSDGTISVDGVQVLEIPARYRHFRELTVRYGPLGLGRIDLVDGRSGLYWLRFTLLDKAANADGRRALIESAGTARLELADVRRAADARIAWRTTGELPPS